mgnify:CR=1 FL=1
MKQKKIAIIGLGYVGLPLARLFATKYPVVGFDINKERVSELMSGKDSTLEVSDEVLKSVLVSKSSTENGLFCSTSLEDIKDCNYFIITVPTPVDKNNRPVLTPLIKASETVGNVLKKGDIEFLFTAQSYHPKDSNRKIEYKIATKNKATWKQSNQDCTQHILLNHIKRNETYQKCQHYRSQHYCEANRYYQ